MQHFLFRQLLLLQFLLLSHNLSVLTVWDFKCRSLHCNKTTELPQTMAAVLFVTSLDLTGPLLRAKSRGWGSHLNYHLKKRRSAGVGDWVAHEWHTPGQRALRTSLNQGSLRTLVRRWLMDLGKHCCQSSQTETPVLTVSI